MLEVNTTKIGDMLSDNLNVRRALPPTWYWIFFIVIVWEVKRILRFFYKSPQNIKIVGTQTVFGHWFTSILHIYDAQRIVTQGYIKAAGQPYAIPARDRYHVCVSDSKHIEELNNASIHQVSLKAAIFDRVFPEQTIDGLQIGDSDHNGSTSNYVFKFRLRSHLPALQPALQERLTESFRMEMSGKSIDGWMDISASRVASRLSARMNTLAIVGKDLSSNPEFFEAVMQYTHDATITEEILQFTPAAFFPFVTMRWSGALNKVKGYLTSLIQGRLIEGQQGDQNSAKGDAVQWIIESSRNPSQRAVNVVLRQTLAFLFGSAHQMPMLITFALYNLCIHPEYIEPLREEIAGIVNDEIDCQNEDMPLLDSFLKETARLNPPTIIGVPRKVLSPFTFSDGTHVPSDNWICVPQQALMRDSAIYPEPDTFNGFRFATSNDGASKSESRFSHPSWLFPFWGSVKQACPARFYVSMAVKMIMVHFLVHYEIQLANQDIPAAFAWGVARIPHPRLRFLVRERIPKAHAPPYTSNTLTSQENRGA